MARSRRRRPARPTARSLAAALRRPGEIACIAEFKRRRRRRAGSTRRPTSRRRSRAYAAGGASALSVLTDEPFFGGRLDDLTPARRAPRPAGAAQGLHGRPLPGRRGARGRRRRDPAHRGGAGRRDARALLAAARELGLDVLVEAHDAAEVERAVAAGAEIIGINNRDLRTFTVDRELAIRLRADDPARSDRRRRVGHPRRRRRRAAARRRRRRDPGRRDADARARSGGGAARAARALTALARLI